MIDWAEALHVLRLSGPMLAVVAVAMGVRLLAARRPGWPRIPVLLFFVYGCLRAVAIGLECFALNTPGVRWLRVAGLVALTWAVLRTVLYLVLEWFPRMRSRAPPAKVVRDLVQVMVFAATGFVLLRTHGQVNLAGLLTTSAVITAVIGFASQTVLSSFFSGIALQIEHPFSLGDWIEIDDYVGQVVGITWRSTRLLDRKNRLVYLPNALVAASRFRVYTRPNPWYTAAFQVGVELDAPPNRVRAVALEVLLRHPRVRANPPPEVRVVAFGDFAITYEVRFTTDDCAAENRTLAELRNDLWYALRREGLRIPVPVRDLRHAQVERRREDRRQSARREHLPEVLAGVPILEPLDPGERERLVRGSRELTFGTGEAVVLRGREGRAMFVVISGACNVFADERPGARPVATIGPGGCFGEMSLLTGAPCNATVRAAEDTVLLEVDKTLFASVLQARPETAERLAGLLAQRQRELDTLAGAGARAEERPASLLARIRLFLGL